MRLKRPAFALVAVVSFFALAEILLGIGGVHTLIEERDPFQGFSARVRVYERDEAHGVYRTRPAAVVHSFNDQQFAADKPDDGFRFFVLGGSSAYGFPWGARVAFPHWLGVALQASWPERRVEAINAAAMSYGSHRLRILVRELLDYEPDLLIVYSGHNEFVERRFYRDKLRRTEPLDAARRVLYGMRTYSAMTRLYERAMRGSGDRDTAGAPTGDLLGLDVDRDYSADVGREEIEEARRSFRANLEALIDQAEQAGVRVVLCTVASNLEGWQPNQSVFDRDRSAEERARVQRLLGEGERALGAGDAQAARARLEAARAVAPEHAMVQFRLGQSYEALGRREDARDAFVLARDADGQPSRAVSVLNETIRQLARERQVLLVDVERAFEAASDRAAPGFDLIEDYVHPNARGHRLIAFELWRAIEERGFVGPPRAVDPSAFDAAIGATAGAVERGDPSRSPTLLLNLALVLENQGLVDQAMAKYREALELDPRYYFARMNLGRLLHLRGKPADAALEFERAAAEATNEAHRVRALVGLGEALQALGRHDEAVSNFERATRIDPRAEAAWSNLGEALAAADRHAEAVIAFRAAGALEPGDADLWANLGFSLLAEGDTDEARAAFGRGIEIEPENRRSHNGLAALLADSGDLEQAERIFAESLRIDPEDRFARGGLALVRGRRTGRGTSGE